MEYEYHPLADQYPLMPDAELQLLAGKMMRNGFNDLFPIVLHEGKILDGRNRYKAACLAFLEPQYIDLPEGTDPQEFVEQANEHRRHLAIEWLHKQRQARIDRVSKARTKGQSTRTIAQTEGVSQKQVMRDLKAQTISGESPDSPETNRHKPLTGQQDTKTPVRLHPSADSDNGTPQSEPLKPAPVPPDSKVTGRDGRKQSATKKPPKPGSVVFDDKEVTDLFSKLAKKVHARGKVYAQSRAYQRLYASVDDAIGAWNEWRKEGKRA